jgi:hypothetical protein
MSTKGTDDESLVSRRSLIAGSLAALAAGFAASAPSSAQAQERRFARPSHTPRVQRPRSELRGPRTHRSMFRMRRRVRVAPPPGTR